MNTNRTKKKKNYFPAIPHGTLSREEMNMIIILMMFFSGINH